MPNSKKKEFTQRAEHVLSFQRLLDDVEATRPHTRGVCASF